MNKITRLLTVMTFGLMLATTAVATDQPHSHPAPSELVKVSESVSSSVSTSKSDANAKQDQEQYQQQDQSQNSTSHSSSGGNVVSNTSSYKQVRQTAMAFAGASNNTAGCALSGGVGISSPVAGISFNNGRRDKDCVLETQAAVAYSENNYVLGDRLRCNTTYMKKLFPDMKECLAMLDSRVPVKREDNTGTDYVTRQEFVESQQRQDRASTTLSK